jgi:phosphoenolpyruvate carboxykinase (ATP)
MEISNLLKRHNNVILNPTREFMIRYSVEKREALISKNGALATWTPVESTGRSPKDTYIVKNPVSYENIDWDSPNNIAMDPETFEMLINDVIKTLKKKQKIFVTERVIGADINYALPVKTITDKALSALFTDNVFRKIPKNIEKSIFYDKQFTLLVLPYDKLDPVKYHGKLRKLSYGTTSKMAVVMNMDKKIGIVYGSAYCGSIKKLMFTVMNYFLPEKGILPLHCSASQGNVGDIALFLGLSGTGKTTLSADSKRALLGDDEHAWSSRGIANFENGCYAKLINLRQQKEPEIWNAVFHKDHYLKHGAIVENAMMYPNGEFDLDDERFTPNSRASYPLKYLRKVKQPPLGNHPKTIIFLTADANGVLPPISKLTKEGAMFWFLIGYTSKLAGTETGIIDPVSVFSRFFGEPFMPRNPDLYARMFGKFIKKYNSKIYLINTGWTGGPYGEGKRIDIEYTRAMVDAALQGKIDKVEFKNNDLFHLKVPKTCPKLPTNILDPKKTWKSKSAYEKRAKKLAMDFSKHFDENYLNKVPELRKVCPGK